MLAHRLLQKRVELFLRSIQCVFSHSAKRQFPIGLGRHLAVSPFQPASGRKFLDSVDERPRARDIIQREVAIETMPTDPPLNFWVYQNGFQLRPEKNVLALVANVERFDTHAIASQYDTPLIFLPKGNREHSSKPVEALLIPLHKGAQDRFRIRV